MKLHAFAIALAVSAAVASPLALAEQSRGSHHQLRGNFVADVTRTTGDGRTLSRHTEQVRTEAGFRRESTFTNPAGKTASRVVEGSYDAANQTYTRTMEGVRANGDTYSSERITQKTEDGFNRTVNRTNADGLTASKQVEVSIDRDNQTITKNITATGFNGEVHTATVVKSHRSGDAEAAAQ